VRDVDWAYLAGIIDGEGCIGIYHHRRQDTWQPRIVVAMSTKEPVVWIGDTFGGKVRRGSRGTWVWGVYSVTYVEAILSGCLPYLRTKRRKAREVIRYCEGVQQQS
jgi:hypothetical protein